MIGVRVLWRLAGRIYAAYHRWVTFRYLVRMARLLDGTQ
jgi:hypothetical protein